MRIIITKNNMTGICLLLLSLTFGLCLLSGCSSGGSESSGDSRISNDNEEDDTQGSWRQVFSRQIQTDGMLSTHVKAIPDDNGGIHLAYFEPSEDDETDYSVFYSLLDAATYDEIGPVEAVIGLDNCRALGLSVDGNGNPFIGYQGGEIRECGSEQESDVMVNLKKNGSWNEHTGGIGYVERNPVFQDGLAGRQVSAAVDSNGDIHLCYQFFYEGCDAMNFNYPDLLYVKIDGSDPDAGGVEEVVEGNSYSDGGMALEQNTVGENAVIIVDANNDPVIFYSADLSPNSSNFDQKGLRVARKLNGNWTNEWVETGFEVSAISSALDRNDNPVAAYCVDGEYEDGNGIQHSRCLKYAKQTENSWETSIIDERFVFGNHCDIAFDVSGNPAVTYYALENHSGSLELRNLQFAIFNGTSWEYEDVASQGDIGTFNSLWFDEEGSPMICSYSETDDSIYLFYREGGE